MIAAGIVLMWLATLLAIVGVIAWRTGAWRDLSGADEAHEIERPLDDPGHGIGHATTQPAAWVDTQPPKEQAP